MDTLKAHPDIQLVRFVLFGREAYQAYEKGLKTLTKRTSD
jgi:O-acetyl-ADP-ribose deacetylase (regulator of RNase III)